MAKGMRFVLLCKVIFVVLLILGSYGSPAMAITTIHVATTGDDTTGDGSEAKPYRTIQKGIDSAIPGDTVLVADGIYIKAGNVNLDFHGKAITVKSKNGAANCIIDCENVVNTRGFYFHSGEGPDSIVDGFNILNGYAIVNLEGGGGIRCISSSPTITNNIIENNNSEAGGGIYCDDSSVVITNNVIAGNYGDDAGGGICLIHSSPTITDNVISTNFTLNYGGGICCYDSSPVIKDNIIVKNIAIPLFNPGLGGGIYCEASSNLSMINNTIAGNSAPNGTGGGIFCDGYSLKIINTILWNNSPNEIIAGGTIDITYSDIQGGWPGAGNISKNPLFINAAGGNYHLSDNSPCISAGTIVAGMPTTDIDGNPRPNPPGSKPDMGACENSKGTPLPPSITLTSPVGGEVWRGGTSHNITWVASGSGIDHIRLLYSLNSGATYPDTIITSTPNNGTYAWAVPALDSGTVRVKAIAENSVNSQLAADASDGNFMIDSTAPETSVADLTGTKGKNDWWTSDVAVALTASDNLSLVKDTRYRINSGGWQIYSGPFIVTGSIVYYRSEDNAGNQEAEKLIEVKIDKSLPTIPVVTDDGIYTTNFSQLHAKWTSSDPESGICGYAYAIGTTPGGSDVANWTQVGADTEVSRGGLSLTDGQIYYFSVRSENCAGLLSIYGTSDGITATTSVWELNLNPGWNLISFSIDRCFYQGTQPTGQPACVQLVNIGDMEFDTMVEWFSSVLTPGDAWETVMGTDGIMDRTAPPSLNNLDCMSPISGYWVKIAEGTGGAKLSLSGQLFNPGCAIPLPEGWSLVGCPLGKGYYDTALPPSGVHVPEGTTWVKVDPPVADHVFGSVAGKFDFIIGEDSAYDPALPSLSSLHYIAPGYGWWIKMNQAADLEYPSGSDTGSQAGSILGRQE